MPTYAYRCRDCGHQFDIFQKFSEDALTVCPNCQGTIRRVIQPTGVVFKGSGFYINDSRSSGKAGTDTAPKASKDADAAPGDTKAADKPAEKASTGDAPAKSDTKTETKAPAAASAS
jgi:putative FmdB family regulatory protein